MVTLRLILALSRCALVALVNVIGRAHAYPGKRVIKEGLPLYTCAGMSNTSPILLEGLTYVLLLMSFSKLGGRERWRLEEVPLSNIVP
jgi:hypothetical protein